MSSDRYLTSETVENDQPDMMPGLNTSSRHAEQHIYIGKNISAAEYRAFKQSSPWKLTAAVDQEAFLQEAGLLKVLEHQHILPLLIYGIDEDIPYIITAYTPMTSLATLMQLRDYHPFPWQEALPLLSQIGQALQYAHQRSIFHGNLHPASIYLHGEQNHILVADFRLTSLARGRSRAENAVSDVSPYLAPEQRRGTIRRESDQYALGCLAYEMLIGALPARGNEVPNASLPPSIKLAIRKAMEPEIEDRYSSVEEFLKALQEPAERAIDTPAEGIVLKRSPARIGALDLPPGARQAGAEGMRGKEPKLSSSPTRRASGVHASRATEALLHALAAGQSGREAEETLQAEQSGREAEEMLQAEQTFHDPASTQIGEPAEKAFQQQEMTATGVSEGDPLQEESPMYLPLSVQAEVASSLPGEAVQDLDGSTGQVIPEQTSGEWRQIETLLWQEVIGREPVSPAVQPAAAITPIPATPLTPLPPSVSYGGISGTLSPAQISSSGVFGAVSDARTHHQTPSSLAVKPSTLLRSWTNHGYAPALSLPQIRSALKWKHGYMVPMLIAAAVLLLGSLAGALLLLVPDYTITGAKTGPGGPTTSGISSNSSSQSAGLSGSPTVVLPTATVGNGTPHAGPAGLPPATTTPGATTPGAIVSATAQSTRTSAAQPGLAITPSVSSASTSTPQLLATATARPTVLPTATAAAPTATATAIPTATSVPTTAYSESFESGTGAWTDGDAGTQTSQSGNYAKDGTHSLQVSYQNTGTGNQYHHVQDRKSVV